MKHLPFLASILMATWDTQSYPMVDAIFAPSALDGWRIYLARGDTSTNVGFLDIQELEFYVTEDCTGPNIDPDGTGIGSGNHPCCQIGGAFDGNTGKGQFWGGRPNSNGKFWLGMEFEETHDVKCVKLFQWHNHYVESLIVQRLVGGFWLDVGSGAGLEKGENVISLGFDDDSLLDAINDIIKHVDGRKTLTRNELAEAHQTFATGEFLIGKTDELISAPLDLVDAYEENYGALFINQKTKNGFKREDNNDNFYLERIIVDVQQTILDRIYSATVARSSNFAHPMAPTVNYPAGRYWQTARFFPGYVEPPNDSSLEYTVQIQATNKET